MPKKLKAVTSGANPDHERQVYMQSFGLALDLKDDHQAVEKYKFHHQHVWPEVETELRRIGILSMKIYLIGRRLFMYMETVDGFDPVQDFPNYLEADIRCRQWEELMQTFQAKLPEAGDNEWWAMMEPVYEL